MPPHEQRIRDIRAYRPSFVGMVLLVCIPFLVLGSASAYGAGVTVALMAGWFVLFAMGCRWFASRPRRVVVVAVLGLLGWTLAAVLANV
jgi:hypothetical protein